MKRIRIFHAASYEELETIVNKFLEECEEEGNVVKNFFFQDTPLASSVLIEYLT